MNGLKTGTTSGAGVCLSASATRDGLSLIAVVLGSPSSGERFDAATALLDYGFANFESACAPVPEGAPAELPVQRGSAETVPLVYAMPENLLVKKGEGQSLASTLELPEELEAPVSEGAQVGTVTVTAGDTELGSWPVTAGGEVPRMTVALGFERLWQALLTH